MIKTLNDVLAEFNAFSAGRPEGQFVFRGQRAGWELKTSLEIACEQIPGPGTNPLSRAADREAFFLREFQRRAHHYHSDLPSLSSPIEWRALLRHHGGPTFLLDSTYSIYVATYFALQHSEQADAASVWIIDADWCKDATVKAFERAGRGGASAVYEEVDGENEERIAHTLFFGGPHAKFVCPINPFRLNERLTIQRGVFLAPGDVYSTMMGNLRSADGFDSGANVKQVNIPRDAFARISVELHEMNISAATLFPGIDGFARSLVNARRHYEWRRPDARD